ncbi:MAG: transposase [Marinifilaceae bacterium]
MTEYPTNLTDKHWQFIEKIINPQDRKRKHSLRDIMNAIFYVNKSGCQWRILPNDFAPWQAVYFYFRKWENEGIIEDMMNNLHGIVRKSMGVMKVQV